MLRVLFGFTTASMWITSGGAFHAQPQRTMLRASGKTALAKTAHFEEIFRFQKPADHLSKIRVPHRMPASNSTANLKMVALRNGERDVDMESLGVSDFCLSVLLVLAFVIGGTLVLQKLDILSHDMQKDSKDDPFLLHTDADQPTPQADPQTDTSDEDDVFVPPPPLASLNTALLRAGNHPKPPGTMNRMGRLPPTAWPSFEALPSQGKKKSWPSSNGLAPISESTQLTSTDCMSLRSSSSSELFLPPPLNTEFADACEDGELVWAVLAGRCQEFLAGDTIEIAGSPSLYARLVTTEGQRRLEVGSTKEFQAPDASVGPLNSCVPGGAAAELFGPKAERYGSFQRTSKGGFTVTHKSRAPPVLSLDPVTTEKGSFLEIAADGHPVCLVNLGGHESDGVEFEPDPDIDASLIVCCVLACFGAAPGLLAGVDTSASAEAT